MLRIKELYLKACQHSEEIYPMTDEDRKKLQQHLRNIYLEIEKVCNRHGLQMMVGYGTVLGAIRHKGFIPWDDDIDLLMPRKDYDRLIHEFADELPKNYKIYAPNSKYGPICRFAKVVDTNSRYLSPGAKDSENNGIFIDIFALENTPTFIPSVKFRRLVACGLAVIATCVQDVEQDNEFYKNLLCSTLKGKLAYSFRWIIGKTLGILNSKRWFNIYDKFVQYKKDTGHFAVPTGESGKWRYFYPYPKELYLPTRRMKFDNIVVNVPNQAERHCEIEYGDWHFIPPEEERWQHFIKEIKFSLK